VLEPELLVVFRSSLAAEQQLPEDVQVVHTASPKVMLVRLPPGVDAAAALGDVVYVGLQPPPEVLSTLDDGERMFVGAWLARRSAEPKARPAEGLPWDAEGLSPPDLPQT
jgi:hypothetical protein